MSETAFTCVLLATGLIAALTVLQCLRTLGTLRIRVEARRRLRRDLDLIRRETDG